jgi:hypothetical protein
LAENRRLVAFWRGDDNRLWHRWQDPDFGWSQEPMALADRLAGGPAAVLAENGRLVAFWRGDDDLLWHRWQDPDFEWRSPPMPLASGLTSDPAAALTDIKRLAAFWRGADNAPRVREQDANFSWRGVLGLGGTASSSPAAVRAQNGALVVFLRRTDEAFQHRWQEWFAETDGGPGLGGSVDAMPTPVPPTNPTPVPTPFSLPLRSQPDFSYLGNALPGLFPASARVSGVTLIGLGSARLTEGHVTHVGFPEANTRVEPRVTDRHFDGQPVQGTWRVNVTGTGLTETNVSLRIGWQ